MYKQKSPPTKETQKKLQEISCFFRELRINSGLTQSQVAEETNIHRNTILRIENNHNFNIINMIALAEYYCIPLPEVVSDLN